MSEQPVNLDQAVRTLQIITAAMVMGVVLFAVVAVVVIGALSDLPDGVIISTIAAGWTVVAFGLHLIVPSLIAKQQLGSVEPQQLPRLYLTKNIIGLAILEGAAMFNVIAVVLEHNAWSLALTGGLLFWMLAMFPTRTRVEQWVETQLMQQGIN